MMGGVRTNGWGETNIRNLYACGETACTGVHGANRLASNSLLETVVFAKRIVERTLQPERGPTPPTRDALRLPDPSARRMGVYHRDDAPTLIGAPGRALLFNEVALSLGSLQTLMWDKVGIVRDGAGLAEAALTLAMWQRSTTSARDRRSHELANLLLAARLTTEGALVRQESRGAHYRTDFPEPDDSWRRHIVFRNDA
jgi:L-aspartate oxidase